MNESSNQEEFISNILKENEDILVLKNSKKKSLHSEQEFEEGREEIEATSISSNRNSATIGEIDESINRLEVLNDAHYSEHSFKNNFGTRDPFPSENDEDNESQKSVTGFQHSAEQSTATELSNGDEEDYLPTYIESE